jgi:hypothetical protein
LLATGGVFNGDIAKIGIGVLGKADHVDVASGIEGHFHGLISAVGDAVIVARDPGLLDLRRGGTRGKGSQNKKQD